MWISHKTHLGDDVRTVVLHLRTAFVIVQKFKLNKMMMIIMIITIIMIMTNIMITIVIKTIIMITCEEGEACVDPPTILLRTTATTAIVITTSTCG